MPFSLDILSGALTFSCSLFGDVFVYIISTNNKENNNNKNSQSVSENVLHCSRHLRFQICAVEMEKKSKQKKRTNKHTHNLIKICNLSELLLLFLLLSRRETLKSKKTNKTRLESNKYTTCVLFRN